MERFTSERALAAVAIGWLGGGSIGTYIRRSRRATARRGPTSWRFRGGVDMDRGGEDVSEP